MALLGFLTVHVAIVGYFAVIAAEKTPERVWPLALTLLLGAGLSGAGLALAPGIWTGAGFASSAGMAGFVLWLLTLRRLPDGALVVEVGDPMPALRATTDTGAPFDLTSMKRRRVMVKFFRGSW